MLISEIRVGQCAIYQGMQVVIERFFPKSRTVTCSAWGGPNGDKLIGFRGIKIKDLSPLTR